MRFGLLCSARATANAESALPGQGLRDWLEFNEQAERLGFYSSFLVEHHFTGFDQVSATLTMLACLAMRTSTLRLGSGVLALPWHHPVLLAEQAATLDLGVARDPGSPEHGSHVLAYQQPGAAAAHALYGTPDQIADGLADPQEGGVTYVLLILETDVAQLLRFRSDVIPRLAQ
jgi:alkanesulfonate monooxygenase SsuD/methylene tetrahydromethanopterin reductase-like flavin-dependent oxidoreductase (luciferase family)